MIVVFDQREKQPWPLPGVETEEVHLETGDYTVKGFEDRFAVERKSIDDLTKSVGTDRDRFEAEIRRAQDMAEFVVVIEGTKQDVLDHDYYSQIHPNAVIGTVEKWPLKYGTLEFIWAGDRETAGQQCLRLLDRWNLLHGTDLF